MKSILKTKEEKKKQLEKELILSNLKILKKDLLQYLEEDLLYQHRIYNMIEHFTIEHNYLFILSTEYNNLLKLIEYTKNKIETNQKKLEQLDKIMFELYKILEE